MEFQTWYQINCESEKEWAGDFARLRETGFDQVVLWNLTIAKQFASHPAYRGAWFDDSFSVRETASPYWSYGITDKKRFREWLEHRYLSIDNLRRKHRKQIKTFASIAPPVNPSDDLALWNDWMQARADWCEDFGRITKETYRAIDKRPEHHLVLNEFDYYLDRNALHHGVDYKRMMRHFDRLEIYMADDHRGVGLPALLANTRYNVRRGLEIAGPKPFQFNTWFAEPIGFTPLKAKYLKSMLECAAENGASAIVIYAYKIFDWTAPAARQAQPFKQVSLKYNPELMKTLARLFRKLKKH